MKPLKKSGQAPLEFVHRPDLSNLPQQAKSFEVDLHGGFAVDDRPDFGHIYYGMPGCGLLRIDPDLKRQELIKLPETLTPLNFHSTKIGEFDGKQRLILPANNDEMVAILTMEGEVDFLLRRPEFDAYQEAETPFRPTDVVLAGQQLFVADGYGSNYIVTADAASHHWRHIFGGETKDRDENGKFGTAHGMNLEPFADLLAIADRWNGRIQLHDHHGGFIASHKLPEGTWPCGVQYVVENGRWLAIVGCLYGDVLNQERPAPIYILDAHTYEILSTVRPKEELGVELAQKLHNVIGYNHGGNFYLICQSWNPGHYFVLQKV